MVRCYVAAMKSGYKRWTGGISLLADITDIVWNHLAVTSICMTDFNQK